MSKTIKVFGYGSLINQESLKQTTPSAKNVKPCKLHGFIRIFNAKGIKYCTSHNQTITALNIEKSEINESVNGIVFEIPETELDELIRREKGYELINVEIEIENKEQKTTTKALTFRYPHFEATYTYLENSKIQQAYYNTCIKGCQIFGKAFLKEFKQTTYIGTKTLKELNF